MATVINNREPNDREVIQPDSSGWMFAIILLLLILAVGVYWMMRHRVTTVVETQTPAIQAPAQPANINVTLPAPTNVNTPANTSPTPAPSREQ